MRPYNAPRPGFLPVPTLYMPLAVWQELMGYVLACPIEVNGFGMIDRLGDDLFLENVFILEQSASGAHAEVEPEVLGAFITDLVRKGEDPSRMRFQWHSHVDMAAYFSSIDLGNIETYTTDWMVSLVTNKRGEFELRLDVYRPYRVWTPLPLKVISPDPGEDVREHCQAEVKAKVSTGTNWLGKKRQVRPSDGPVLAHVDADTIEIWSE